VEAACSWQEERGAYLTYKNRGENMKLISAIIALVCMTVPFAASAAECESESIKAALISTIQQWNIDGATVGTSFKATGVKLKPGSEGRQGTFTNIVSLEIFEAGRGSTLSTSVEVDAQNIGTCQTFNVQ